MCVSKPKTLYAVGSQSHVNLVDPRSKNTLTTIISKYRGGGKFPVYIPGFILVLLDDDYLIHMFHVNVSCHG